MLQKSDGSFMIHAHSVPKTVTTVNNVAGSIRRRLLGLTPEETSYKRRGFCGASETIRRRLEEVGAAFVSGYHTALELDAPRDPAASLNRTNPELRGFVFEGAAMGL